MLNCVLKQDTVTDWSNGKCSHCAGKLDHKQLGRVQQLVDGPEAAYQSTPDAGLVNGEDQSCTYKRRVRLNIVRSHCRDTCSSTEHSCKMKEELVSTAIVLHCTSVFTLHHYNLNGHAHDDAFNAYY